MSASRRDFLRWSAMAGAALVIPLPILGKEQARRAAPRFAPNQWLRVGTDGKVTLIVARSEMGQGVRTCLAMILAEELEADWSSISIEQASPTPLYDDMNTGGSDSVESSWMPLRRAAATARLMLVEAAAKLWPLRKWRPCASCGRLGHRFDEGFHVIHIVDPPNLLRQCGRSFLAQHGRGNDCHSENGKYECFHKMSLKKVRPAVSPFIQLGW